MSTQPPAAEARRAEDAPPAGGAYRAHFWRPEMTHAPMPLAKNDKAKVGHLYLFLADREVVGRPQDTLETREPFFINKPATVSRNVAPSTPNNTP